MNTIDSQIEETRVLVIYTGGTIGMMRTEKGLAPIAGWLPQKLESLSCFHDPSHGPLQKLEPHNLPTLCLPRSRFYKKVLYSINEYDPLLDSSVIDQREWLKMAQDIKQYYSYYSSFVILHGTDTMAYTACALSFLLQNLGKTVIITGSMLAFSEPQNDARDNLLGALSIAGHFCIPEVLLYFNNKLFRGNRCSKVDACNFAAFDSPNCLPIGEVGVTIRINWTAVYYNDRCDPDQEFEVGTNMDTRVAVLYMHPGITYDIIKHTCSPPTKGVVIVSFGSGNIPGRDGEFLQIFEEANKNGIVVINVRQCRKGVSKPDYVSGLALQKVGVLNGNDLTIECAVTKLSYLLGRYGCDSEESLEKVRCEMEKEIRGEMTFEDLETKFFDVHEKNFLRTLSRVLDSKKHDELVGGGLLPTLMCTAAANGDLKTMQYLLHIHARGQPTSNILRPDYDGRTPLHIAASFGHLHIVKFLVDEVGCDMYVKDRWGSTPLNDAVVNEKQDVVKFLSALECSGYLSSVSNGSCLDSFDSVPKDLDRPVN